MSYHLPVLAAESIDALAVKRDGRYVDATFGGGGHSRLILDRLGPDGKLYAFDQDEDALANVPDDERLVFNHHNFRYLKRFLRLHGERPGGIDGLLADLGVSSHQFDVAERGFSFRFDAPLDMRMNQQADTTAADLLATYSAERLQSIFSRYGEVRNAKTLAQAIVEARRDGAPATIGAFLELVGPLIRGGRNRYLAQVFQALRMEVNQEEQVLEALLQGAWEMLRPGGRLVVLSYHSIEDRIVKNFLKTGNAAGEVERDWYGNIKRPYKLLTKKAVAPSEAEIARNPRARSAKMRVAEKLDIIERTPPGVGS